MHNLNYLLRFLPCTSDWQQLLVMSDMCEEHRNALLAEHLRHTADLWQREVGLKRDDCCAGRSVWVRYSAGGWAHGLIVSVSPKHIYCRFPLFGDPVQGWRAWWDLEQAKPDFAVSKPEPRRDYTTLDNSWLASFLTGQCVEYATLPNDLQYRTIPQMETR